MTVAFPEYLHLFGSGVNSNFTIDLNVRKYFLSDNTRLIKTDVYLISLNVIFL